VGCLAPLLTTKPKHEGGMLWAKFVSLAELASVGPSIVKVLGQYALLLCGLWLGPDP
jgi:hypothetical protein